MIRFLLFLMLILSVRANQVGTELIFDVPFAIEDNVRSINATLRNVKEYRPGFPIKLWVENEQWFKNTANGLNSDTPLTDLQSDRISVLQDFANWLAADILPELEGAYFQLTDPVYTQSSGLNILFTDIEDDYKNTGSFVGAHFFPADQSPSAGFNSMNLIYIDISPGTLGFQLDNNISKKNTYREFLRNLGRLLFYQLSPEEDELWVHEGFSQFLIYRLLGSSKTFPYSPTRILGAPSHAVPEADIWLAELSAAKPGYPFLSEYHHTERDELKNLALKNLDRVFVTQNPRLPADNLKSPYFRGFSYLFFTYLFHRTGGNFQKRLTDGDRFFQELIKERNTGFEGIERALSKRNAPDFRTLYTEFSLSLFLNVTEERFKKQAYSFPYPSPEQFVQSTQLTQPDQFVLEPWALDVRRFKNPDSILWEGRINILPRFDYSRIFLMSRDAGNNFFIEEELGSHKNYFFVPSGEEKYLLFLNLDSAKKTHRVELFQKNYNQQVIVPNSSGNFGAVSTEIIIDSSLVPSYDQTGSVSITLMQSGIYDFYVTNESPTPLLWSVEKKADTTNLFFESSRKVSLSVQKSHNNLNNERTLLQRDNSREKFIFIYPGTQRLDFSLFFTALDPKGFTEESTKTSPSAGEVETTQDLSQYAGGGMSGCFIATATFGSPDHTIVRTLSSFRDHFLLKTGWGKEFVRFYYHYSPKPASFIAKSFTLRFFCALLLLPFFLGVLIFLFVAKNLQMIGFILVFLSGLYLLRKKAIILRLSAFIFLLLLSGIQTTYAVNFINNDPEPNRSAQLREIARTMKNIAQNSFDLIGGLRPPYSNQNDEPILNVFLYDIRDGQSSVEKALPGYFSPYDQLRTSGPSPINDISNFGNIIYLDINPYDPTRESSDIQANQLTKNILFGDKFYFYQNFSAQLLKLLMFQQQNPDYKGENFYYSDYEWLVEGLANFAAFRFTRNIRLCTSTSLISCDGPYIFNTHRTDEYGDPHIPMMTYPAIRFLHFSHNVSETKLYPLPGLFHADLSAAPPQGSGIDNKEYTDVSFGIGYLFFLYLWEQLEGEEPGLGDKFITRLIKKGSKNFIFNGKLEVDRIYSPYYADDPIPENHSVFGTELRAECSENQDKICQINHLLKSLTADNSNYVPKSFEEYYLNFVGAVVLNKYSELDKPDTFELRNVNLSATKKKNTERSHNNPNLSFDTGNNQRSIDYTWIISEEELRRALSEPTAEETGEGATENPEQTIITIPREQIPLSAFSFATVLMNNVNPNSDLRFPYGDLADLNDNGAEDRTTNSILAQLFRNENREKCSDIDPENPNACIFTAREAQKGKGYFIIPRSESGAGQSTGVAAFIGLRESGIKFKQTGANFSRLKISAPDEVTTETDNPFYSRPELLFRDWQEYLMQTGTQNSELNFSTSATGIKTYNSFQPIHEVKGKSEWTNAPEAFRQYTHSFKTIDYERTNKNTIYIEGRRTGILKEIVEIDYPPCRIFLWVDQRNLPESDSSTLPTDVTTEEQPSEPLPPGEQKNSVSASFEVTRMSFFNNQNEEINRFEQIIKISGLRDLDLVVKNWLDVPVTVQFFLPDGSPASTMFEIINSDTAASVTYVITRNSVLKSTNSIDNTIALSRQSQKGVRIRSKLEGNIENPLIISIRKNVSLSADSVTSQEQSGGGSSGCFIATAAYGAEHKNVALLCSFRDQILLKKAWGRRLVELYYNYSPPLARKIKRQGFSGTITRLLLYPIVSAVSFFSDVTNEKEQKSSAEK